MTQPESAPLRIGAFGERSVAAHTIGDVHTGDTINLPKEALIAPAEVAVPPGLNNLPEPASPLFLGREEAMTELRERMQTSTGVVTQAVHGLGGVGKTTLALHYAHDQRAEHTAVWWLTASTSETIEAGLAELAVRVYPARDIPSITIPMHAEWARAWLQAYPGWLLIFDNAENPDHVAPLIGQLPGGHHLITTRRATGWHHLTPEPLRLDVLTPQAAIDLLTRITGENSDEGRRNAGKLAKELGFLPLALEQAAAYIQHNQTTHARYLTHLTRYPARMFATPPGGGTHARTLARIWRITLDTISATTPLAVDLLRTLAFLAPDHVPRDLLEAADADDPLAIEEALGLLHSYSMITLTPQDISTHRLVQAVARTPDASTGPQADPHRTPELIDHARQHATAVLNRALPEDPSTHVAGWPRWRTLLPHIEALINLTDPAQDTSDIHFVLNETAVFLNGQGQVAQAITYHERSMATAERLFGTDHRETLTSCNNLAYAYESAGDLARAIPLYEATLIDRERVLGTDHP
ncbi:tetratricopeptide repeat protein, partial [Streptomyces sp. NPDC060223]